MLNFNLNDFEFISITPKKNRRILTVLDGFAYEITRLTIELCIFSEKISNYDVKI